MIKDVYSNWKAVHHQERLNILRGGELCPPSQLQIDPFNPCNHDCTWCFYRYDRNEDLNKYFKESDFIPYDKMCEILEDAVSMGCIAVELSGGGSPTLHPRFDDIARRAKELNMEFALVTNGSRLTEERCKLLSFASWVRVSLDAVNEETHVRIHKGKPDDFSTAVQGIQWLLKYRQPNMVVGISFVVDHANYVEIVDAAKMAKQFGVDNIRFSAAYLPTLPDYHEKHYIEACKNVELAKGLEDENFKVFAFTEERMRAMSSFEYGEGDKCWYQHFTAVIGADQWLYPCCIFKYRPQGRIVSLKDKRLEHAWYGPERQKYIEKLRLDEQCSGCWLKPKNDFLSYLVAEDVPHVNFV